MNTETLAWWALLCTVSLCNVLAWAVSARLLWRGRTALDTGELVFRQRQLLLSAAYVLGCAYRSALPVFDIPRLSLVDSAWASAAVGRSVATVAELCFAAQWALLLRETSRAAGSTLGRALSNAVVPLIVVAEFCSWHAVLSTANLGHVLEESLWGLTAILMVLGLLEVGRRSAGQARILFMLLAALATAYACYMFAVDVPMYWARWVADEAAGRAYLDLLPGLIDASSRWTVSHRWEDWRSEAVWMSLYFSTAVWLSIGLAHVPTSRYPARARAPSKPVVRPASMRAN